MYFHPHFTHSAPPPDTPGALRHHSGGHPQFTSLCHLPNILVSNPCLNSSDLGTSGPQDLRTSESRSLIGTSGPSLSQLHLHYSILFNTFCFPFRNHCMYILHFPFRHPLARPLTQVLGNIQSQDLLGYLVRFWPLLFIGCPLDLFAIFLIYLYCSFIVP